MRTSSFLIVYFSTLSLLIFGRAADAHQSGNHHRWQEQIESGTPNTLPLGTNKYSSVPQRGYVWSCQQTYPSTGVGFTKVGPWIDEASGVYYPNDKPQVEGTVFWPNSKIDIRINKKNGQRLIMGNQLPRHPTGEYPIQSGTDAYEYDPNPNSIKEQNVQLVLPLSPPLAPQPSCLPPGMIGFTLTGAAIFNALDETGHDAPAYEVQDLCNGHPEQQGGYHYHSLSPCMAKLARRNGGLIGFMLDGIPIYGPNEMGRTLRNEDLDECHGHIGSVKLDGKMVDNVYHYHATHEFPYTIGCFKGKPVQLPPSPNSPPPPL
ncbi:MAG: YHYH protein [Holosporales bacterium]